MLRLSQSAAEEKTSNQMSIFGGPAGGKTADPPLPQVADLKLHERLQAEFESVGFYLTAHPLDSYAVGLKRLGAVRSADLARSLSGGASSRVKLAGTVLSSKERTSAKGNKFAFVQLSDAGGTFEVMVFSELLAKSRELFASNKPLLVTADARVEGETVKLLASEVRALDDAVASTWARSPASRRRSARRPRARGRSASRFARVRTKKSTFV
jgi:DNA polymerase-3 subunit alpha